MKKIILLLIYTLILSSCNNAYDSTEFIRYLSNPENGLVQTKRIQENMLQVKYLPAEYLALKQMGDGESVISYDSLLDQYNTSWTFFMTIKRTDGKPVLYTGVSDYQQYSDRNKVLNFSIEDNISIKKEDVYIKPVLSHMEHNYGLTGEIGFYLVFEPTDFDEEIDIVFHDDYFETGINHFRFKHKDITRKYKLKN